MNKNETKNVNLLKGIKFLLKNGFVFLDPNNVTGEALINMYKPVGVGGGGEVYCIRYVGNDLSRKNKIYAVKIYFKTKYAEQEVKIISIIVWNIFYNFNLFG